MEMQSHGSETDNTLGVCVNVDRRHDIAVDAQVRHAIRLGVADADRPDSSLLLELLHRPA
jgi:hypothetical protein